MSRCQDIGSGTAVVGGAAGPQAEVAGPACLWCRPLCGCHLCILCLPAALVAVLRKRVCTLPTQHRIARWAASARRPRNGQNDWGFLPFVSLRFFAARISVPLRFRSTRRVGSVHQQQAGLQSLLQLS